MAEPRCASCSRVNLVSVDDRGLPPGGSAAEGRRGSIERCACGSPYGQELATVTGSPGEQLTRAWLSLGVGGLSLFVVSALTLGNMAWSTAATCITSIGVLLVIRGARVVAKTGVLLVGTVALAALPAARVVAPRDSDDDDAADR
jgi:hypothetical protein